MTPQDISCATFIAKHILHQQQTVTDVPAPKRRTQKDIGVQNLHNQINKLRLENQMLKIIKSRWFKTF